MNFSSASTSPAGSSTPLRRKYRDANLIKQIAKCPPRIGELWEEQGGLYAGIMRGEAAHADYHLIVPTDPRTSIKSIAWAKAEHVLQGVFSELDGLANTQLLCATADIFPAANWARGLHVNGFQDYYLPARHELLLMYLNLARIMRLHHCYWSSTIDAGNLSCAWVQDVNYGDQYTTLQSGLRSAWAVRRVMIE